MDREIHWFEDHSCYIVRWSGEADLSSLLKHWGSIASDPRFRPGFAALHDCRGLAVEPGMPEITTSARAYRTEVEPDVGFGRLAILADSEALVAAARRLIALLELRDAIVTTSEPEARSWVGLPAGSLAGDDAPSAD